MQLADKKILLGVSGGIAAYKCADLVRRLREQGADVRVVMTEAAGHFITPLTMQALSGNPVHDGLWDLQAESAMGHIELARWADLVLIAPASADLIARLSYGHANDLLLTLCLATAAPIAIAPAMNQQMWQNLATQSNIALLQQRGIKIWGPANGEQACGDVGPGRMLEAEQLLVLIQQSLSLPLLATKKVVITAGPTQEALDPVRYISNHSSGKMGYAIARAATYAGAQVSLISGPVSLTTPTGVKRIDVCSARDMQQAVMDEVRECDIFIAVAAVADYHCDQIAAQKIKKQQQTMQISLQRNPDILAEVAALKDRPFCVGFAAETEQLRQHATQKLQQKNLDMIVANQVGKEQGFISDDNTVTVISHDDEHHIERTSKEIIANKLIQLIAAKVKS